MQLKQTLLAIAFASSALSLQAQSASIEISPSIGSEEFESLTINENDWTFFLDADSKTYYIDFENISVNLNDVKVYDESGEIVKEDDLWNLPVNTIYELNFEDMTPGKYQIELRTYTGKFTKEITIAD